MSSSGYVPVLIPWAFSVGDKCGITPNMCQTCLVVKLLDIHHCFGRKLRPRDVKGHGAAELEWRRGAEDS